MIRADLKLFCMKSRRYQLPDDPEIFCYTNTQMRNSKAAWFECVVRKKYLLISRLLWIFCYNHVDLPMCELQYVWRCISLWIQLNASMLNFVQWPQTAAVFYLNKKKTKKNRVSVLCSAIFYACKIDRIVLVWLMHIINIFNTKWIYGMKDPKLNGQSNKTDNNVKPSILKSEFAVFLLSIYNSTNQSINSFNEIQHNLLNKNDSWECCLLINGFSFWIKFNFIGGISRWKLTKLFDDAKLLFLKRVCWIEFELSNEYACTMYMQRFI